VSSTVTFLLAVMPVLRVLAGTSQPSVRPVPMAADFDWPKPVQRREFLRVRIGGDGALELFPNQSSGVLTSMVWADGLVDNPPGHAIRRGDVVPFLPLPLLLQ
jgi:molybdopterin molybdotransferase